MLGEVGRRYGEPQVGQGGCGDQGGGRRGVRCGGRVAGRVQQLGRRSPDRVVRGTRHEDPAHPSGDRPTHLVDQVEPVTGPQPQRLGRRAGDRDLDRPGRSVLGQLDAGAGMADRRPGRPTRRVAHAWGLVGTLEVGEREIATGSGVDQLQGSRRDVDDAGLHGRGHALRQQQTGTEGGGADLGEGLGVTRARLEVVDGAVERRDQRGLVARPPYGVGEATVGGGRHQRGHRRGQRRGQGHDHRHQQQGSGVGAHPTDDGREVQS